MSPIFNLPNELFWIIIIDNVLFGEELMKYKHFDMPNLDYFQFKNIYSGSIHQEFQYKIFPMENTLKAAVWIGPFCYEKSELLAEQEFPLDQYGFVACLDWIDQQYENQSHQ